MELEGLKVLVDGISLEQIQGTGLKTYALGLLEALRMLGANPNVLISKYSVKEDKRINAHALALFQDQLFKPWLRYNYALVIKTLLGLRTEARSTPLPKDMVLTRGMESLAYVNEFSIYVSRGCYALAEYLRYFGFKVKIRTNPQMDIWHATYFTPITVPGAAKITTIHDLVPLRLPYATTNDKGFFIHQVRSAIESSQLIICVSENTKQDLLQFFAVEPEKTMVTYQPVVFNNPPLTQSTIAQNLRYYDLEYKNYVLFVGAIEPKKNLKRLITAWLSIDMDMPLAIVGKKAWLWEQELGALLADGHAQRFRRYIQERIRLLDYVPASDLAALYKGAQCLVFPSLYEGFGLPPLEAMTLGCPVVTSSTSSMPEICEDAALYVDPYDTSDIAAKLDTIINDDELKTRLITAGYKRAAFFSMENYVNRLKAAYAKIG